MKLTRILPIVAVAGSLTACATAPVPANTLRPPAEAQAVASSPLPGVAAIIWVFRDGGQYMCGVTQDKGLQITPENITSKYAKLADGGYSYQVAQGNIPISALIKDEHVYATQDDGKQGELSGDQAQIFLDGFKSLRATCSGLIESTRDALAPATGGPLRPDEMINLGSNSLIKQVRVIGY